MPITTTPDSDGKIAFEYEIPDHISYLSVKAVMEDQEIYYQPIEVITIWGSLTRASYANRFFLLLGGVTLVCCCLIRIRRKKKEYQELKDDGLDY